MDCLFCNIVHKNSPAELVFEDDLAVVFKDIHPKAPTHLLVVPKKHLTSLAHATDDDAELLGHLLMVVQGIAKDKGLSGYKTIINTGRDGGQVVDHLHVHLLAGSPDLRAE